jgi:hypothetical protein
MIATPAHAWFEEDRISEPDGPDPVRAAVVMMLGALVGWLATVTLVWFAVRQF